MSTTNPKIVDKQIELQNTLHTNVISLGEVYGAAIVGYKYQIVTSSRLAAKFGSKMGRKTLTKKELREMKEMIEFHHKKEKATKITFTIKEIGRLRKMLTGMIKVHKKIPALAREQYVISLDLVFEAFVADSIRNIFDNRPETMKSTKTTLKDEEIIDATISGSSLIILREKLIREIMYGSVKDWSKFLRVKKLNIQEPSSVVELGLLRNCIIHNNSKASSELFTITNKDRFAVGRKIIVTNNDMRRYKKGVYDYTAKISKEIISKFK